MLRVGVRKRKNPDKTRDGQEKSHSKNRIVCMCVCVGNASDKSGSGSNRYSTLLKIGTDKNKSERECERKSKAFE